MSGMRHGLGHALRPPGLASGFAEASSPMSATVTFASAQIQAAYSPRATGRSECDPEGCTGHTGHGVR